MSNPHGSCTTLFSEMLALNMFQFTSPLHEPSLMKCSLSPWQRSAWNEQKDIITVLPFVTSKAQMSLLYLLQEINGFYQPHTILVMNNSCNMLCLLDANSKTWFFIIACCIFSPVKHHCNCASNDNVLLWHHLLTSH